jgi:hypothetical protein
MTRGAAALLTAALVAALAGNACGDRSVLGEAEVDGGPIYVPFDTGPEAEAAPDVELDDSAGLQDALPDATGDACSPAGSEPGPIVHLCSPPTSSECDGRTDPDPDVPNDTTGNGFDDDCDGQVDEGCSCGAGVKIGQKKPCFLVPATQTHPAEHVPVGWCFENSRGEVACMKGAGDASPFVWSGLCEGAEQPFADDICAPGDFDCDGRVANSRSQDCRCP